MIVTDPLLELVRTAGASRDKGTAFFVDLAARHVAVARGLGFAGVYLGGMCRRDVRRDPRPEQTVRAATGWRSRARSSSRWKTSSTTLEHDPGRPVSRPTYVTRPTSQLKAPPDRPARAGGYRFSRVLHPGRFAPGRPLTPAGRAITARSKGAEAGRQGRARARAAAKVSLFTCKDCGDCSLPEIAYLCRSPCARRTSATARAADRDGLCEVYDTECIWSPRPTTAEGLQGGGAGMLARPCVSGQRSRGCRAHGRTPSSAGITRRMQLARRTRCAGSVIAPGDAPDAERVAPARSWSRGARGLPRPCRAGFRVPSRRRHRARPALSRDASGGVRAQVPLLLDGRAGAGRRPARYPASSSSARTVAQPIVGGLNSARR